MKVKLESNRNEIKLGDIKYGELFVEPARRKGNL